MAVLALLVAQAATSPDLTAIFTGLNIGLAGVGLLAFVKGWIVPGKVHAEAVDRLVKQHDQTNARLERVEEELRELRSEFNDKFIAEIERNRSAQQTMSEVARDMLEYVEKSSANN